MSQRILPLLQWLDARPGIYFLVVGGWLVFWLVRAVTPLLTGPGDDRRTHDWRWGLVILSILVAGRWPSLIFTQELNPDESQLLAGAHALIPDPVFWRSVNGWTAGPLDFFALWPAGGLVGWDSYLAARLTALALLAAALALAHQALALSVGRNAARLATLTAGAFEALTHAADWLHYSTELVPVALLGAAGYAASRRWCTGGPLLWTGLGGLALGAVPFAKLQAAPLAFLAGVGWLIMEWRDRSAQRHRRLTYLVAGALLPAGLFASQLTLAGEWTSFWLSYVRFNLVYTAESQRSLTDTLTVMLGNALWWDKFLPYALLGGLAWLALLVRMRPVADPALRRGTWLAFAASLVALASILAPHRPFLHYWQLLLLPGAWLLASLMARLLATSPAAWVTTERRIVAGGAVAMLGWMLLLRGLNPNLFVGEMAYFWHFHRSPLAAHVIGVSRGGERLAVWGRADHLFVEANLIQATRDSHGQFLLEAGPLREYFRERYLADFVTARPALFIDTVNPANRYYRADEFVHDRNFPRLAAVVRQDYVLVDRFEGVRIYRRRDLVGP